MEQQWKTDEDWMRLALEQARLAAANGEVPVGALVVQDGRLLSIAHNCCEARKDATAHAECLAISEASKQKGSWRLSDCTLYVTLEPCPMCAGAAINSRISKIIYGAKNPRAGSCGTLIRLQDYPLESSPDCRGGILQEECLAVLQTFFEQKRHHAGKEAD